MNERNRNEAPQIVILMAIYDPKMDWLKAQLDSINAQNYPNIRLYIRDDCSPTVPFETIRDCIQACITKFPYELTRNEQNLGSNLTFEHLTSEAEGDYFAFCDQDDIWLPEKLERYIKVITEEESQLVCSDMYIINGHGKIVADSITKKRRHHIFRSGEGLYDTLWYSNFVSGCAMLVRAETAKAALPFNPHMFYDHYITLWGAVYGKISFIPDPLIYHREHGSNQSGGMPGVYDRGSYKHERVKKVLDAVRWNQIHLPTNTCLRRILETAEVWMDARLRYLNGERACAKTVWIYRKYSPMACLFELASPWMPDWLFMSFVEATKRNIL